MKKLNITKEAFNKSKYFTKKYGTLKYVSESGKLFKTSKGKVLKFNESNGEMIECPYCGEPIRVSYEDDGVECPTCGEWVEPEYDGDDDELVRDDEYDESHDNIRDDPSYECPNCGSHNCEFQTADDMPDKGYFQGSKIHGKFLCLDCEQDYDVEYTLTVTKVTPN